jgi:nucleoside triphosphate pyrophosphatase
MKKLILASQSPRRKQLLEQIGLPFEVYPSDIDEILDPSLTPLKQVEVLSQQKACAVASKFTNAIILAADTMVSFDGQVYGKPKDKKDAIRMLKKFSGTSHSIVTGFTLTDTETKKTVTKSTETKIWFRKITSAEIESFLEKEKPYDKAGAYAIHELASIFTEKVEGDFFGAVGLSVYQVAKELKKFGIEVL